MDNSFSRIIVDKFTKKFISTYKGLSGADKIKVLKYSPVLFKRWYYSALVNETTLSPSFIHGANAEISNTVSAPSITPQISGTHFKGFSFTVNKYGVMAHPAVNDVKILLGFCVPDVELDENDRILPAFAEKISSFLSLADLFYVEYLTAVAFELNFLKKVDAANSNKAAISNNYTLFERLNQEDALKKIVDASVRICSKNISAALPDKLPLVSESGIVELIKKPLPVDEIFKRIFGAFGADTERIWGNYGESRLDAPDEQDAMLSSTFYLGVMLDKWFITPFGEYLKIIEPIYCFCYNFDVEVSCLLEAMNSGGNIESALFSPCAFYSFTPFGRRFFALDANGPEKRKSPPMPVSELLNLLNFNDAKLAPDGRSITSKEIYSFKVKLTEDKRYWKQIDAAEYNTLHELHMVIAVNFGFSLAGYVFYGDEVASTSDMYRDPKAKGSQCKADKATLDELCLKKGDKLLYVSDSGKKLEVELLKRTPQARSAHYPQTVRTSKLLMARNIEL